MMLRRLPARWLLIASLWWAGLAAGQAQDFGFIPGSEHVFELESRRPAATGLVVFAAEFSGSAPGKLLGPGGFVVHLANADDPRDQRVEPAGEPFVPRPGRWRIFVEGESSITPYSNLYAFHGQWPRGHLSIRALPVVPAGRVEVDPEIARGRDLELRLLYAGDYSANGALRHELSRRRAVADLRNGLLMPQGPVLAALWDRHLERYTALSRTFTVRAGETAFAPLERPGPQAAFLVVNVFRPPGATVHWIPGLVLSVEQGGRAQRADVTVATAWGTYSVWYGMAPGKALITGGNEKLFLEPTSVVLGAGEIARVERQLIRRAFLANPSGVTEDRRSKGGGDS